MPCIPPVDPPYDAETGAQLGSMMPPGVPPLLLFRTFARNLPLARAMTSWGRHELGRDLTLTIREREIVIDRTTARCSCAYEWGVHVAFFAARVGLSDEQVSSLVHGDATDPCWTDERERLLVEVVDELHDHSDLGDDLWQRVSRSFDDDEVLDLLLLCGWYHAISFAANGARVDLEPGAPRFADVRP